MKEKRHNKECIICFEKSANSKSRQCIWVKATSYNKIVLNRKGRVVLGDATNIIAKKLSSKSIKWRGAIIDSLWINMFLNSYKGD
jgi:hypothetical protein